MNILNSKKNKIKAILFDFDGVIFDTEPLWFKATINTLKYLKIPYNKKINYKDQIGINFKAVLDQLLINKITKKQKNQINKRFNKEFKKIFSKRITTTPFLKKFVKATNLPIAIVSNSSKNHIINLLKKVKIYKFFNTKNIISCSGNLKPKPFPDGYLKGIQILNISPNNILVIEDSDNGIKSAKKAGIRNILRYTNQDKNLSNKIIYKDIKQIKSFKKLLS